MEEIKKLVNDAGKVFKIFVDRKEVLNYDFSYLKTGIYEVLISIGIEMAKLGYVLPYYLNKAIPPDKETQVMNVPNCLHFRSESNVSVDTEKIKSALDKVKSDYLEISKVSLVSGKTRCMAIKL